MNVFYTLDKNKNVIPCDMEEFARILGSTEKIIKQEELKNYRISTIFLGTDYQGQDDAPPLFFETMIFPLNDYERLEMRRYSTYEEAMKGHNELAEEWRDK